MTVEGLVAEHLLAEVGNLDIEAQLSSELLRYRIEHQGEKLLAVNIFFILPLAINSALREEVRRHERTPPPKSCQEVGHHPLLLPDNNHVRLQAVALFKNGEQLHAVKEVAAAHLGQVAASGVDGYVLFDRRHAGAKIRNIGETTKCFNIFRRITSKKERQIWLFRFFSLSLHENLQPTICERN
jgi:hypothetical protein